MGGRRNGGRGSGGGGGGRGGRNVKRGREEPKAAAPGRPLPSPVDPKRGFMTLVAPPAKQERRDRKLPFTIRLVVAKSADFDVASLAKPEITTVGHNSEDAACVAIHAWGDTTMREVLESTRAALLGHTAEGITAMTEAELTEGEQLPEYLRGAEAKCSLVSAWCKPDNAIGQYLLASTTFNKLAEADGVTVNTWRDTRVPSAARAGNGMNVGLRVGDILVIIPSEGAAFETAQGLSVKQAAKTEAAPEAEAEAKDGEADGAASDAGSAVADDDAPEEEAADDDAAPAEE